MAHIVIIRDADGGTVAEQVAELEAELDPAGGVLGMAVGLIARKKQQVRILRLELVDDFRALASRPAGIA